jgi:hypothetical protein
MTSECPPWSIKYPPYNVAAYLIMNGLVKNMKANQIHSLFPILEQYELDKLRPNLNNMIKRHASGKQKCNEGLIPDEILEVLRSGSLPKRRGKKATAGLGDAAAGTLSLSTSKFNILLAFFLPLIFYVQT